MKTFNNQKPHICTHLVRVVDALQMPFSGKCFSCGQKKKKMTNSILLKGTFFFFTLLTHIIYIYTHIYIHIYMDQCLKSIS